jgi:hypothetical protein
MRTISEHYGGLLPMIRYFRYVEPEVPQERIAPKSQSPKPRAVVVPQVQVATEPAPISFNTDMSLPTNETLLAGVEQLQLTAPVGPLRKAKKGKPAPRKPKVPTTDGSTGPALPLLTGFEV